MGEQKGEKPNWLEQKRKFTELCTLDLGVSEWIGQGQAESNADFVGEAGVYDANVTYLEACVKIIIIGWVTNYGDN